MHSKKIFRPTKGLKVGAELNTAKMGASRVYKSSERIEDSSSSDDDQETQVRDLLSRSPSPASSEIRSSSLALSTSPSASESSGSRSPTRSPSLEAASSCRYAPPSSYELSTSKAKSILPSVRSHHQVFRLRIPPGVSLDQVKFNFQRRRIRIGEEEWKLMEESIENVRLIRPIENSEEFGFGIFLPFGWSDLKQKYRLKKVGVWREMSHCRRKMH